MANRTVLLIDYEPRSIEDTSRPLRQAGFHVEIAHDGLEGVEAFRRLKPDLVLVEAMLPKKHGFNVCQEIKGSPDGRSTPVLITTGVYRGRKYREQAFQNFGCDEYVEKPIDDKELIRICNRFVAEMSAVPEPEPEAAPVVENHATREPDLEKLSEDELGERLDALLADFGEATDDSGDGVDGAAPTPGAEAVVDEPARVSEPPAPIPSANDPTETAAPASDPETDLEARSGSNPLDAGATESAAPIGPASAVFADPVPAGTGDHPDTSIVSEPRVMSTPATNAKEAVSPPATVDVPEPAKHHDSSTIPEIPELPAMRGVSNEAVRTAAPIAASAPSEAQAGHRDRPWIRPAAIGAGVVIVAVVLFLVFRGTDDAPATPVAPAEAGTVRAVPPAPTEGVAAASAGAVARTEHRVTDTTDPTGLATDIAFDVDAITVVVPEHGPVPEVTPGADSPLTAEPATHTAKDPTTDEGDRVPDSESEALAVAVAAGATESATAAPAIEEPTESAVAEQTTRPGPEPDDVNPVVLGGATAAADGVQVEGAVEPGTPSEAETGDVLADPETLPEPIPSPPQASTPTGEPKSTTPPVENVAPEARFRVAPPAVRAPRTREGQLVPLEDVDRAPVAVRRKPPAYHPIAQRMRQQGTVILNVLIDETGHVADIEVVNGIPKSKLNDAAVEAVRTWTYEPARKDGVPVKVWKTEAIHFKL